ncbi:MAG: DNA mismatch repair endonuclease MutL, partial [Halioglobus sp.]|nr:DNA mismatch repair endonuclease MutL [Halioglobus sp.]
GAQAIAIDIIAGGSKLLRVRDDGSGIPRDELQLALSRHATSKISSLEDLEAVASLGFRGEALPSIASVARLTLISRTADADTAWSLSADNGRLSDPRPAAHPLGTTVEVEDLFFNTPARRKFLRTERTEFGHIDKWIRRLALARPDVSFSVSHNRRKVLSLPAARDRNEELQRIGNILGESFSSQAVYVSREAEGLAIRGWLGLPTFNRSQPDLQYWFVNGRSIGDKTLSHAARHAYRDVLFHGRYPAYVLHINIDPASVDANAHPAKHEVRFRDGRRVHGIVSQSLEQALADTRPGAHEQSPVRAPVPGHGSFQQQPMRLSSMHGRHAVADALDGWQRLAAAELPTSPEADRRQDHPAPQPRSDDTPPMGYALAQ